MPEELHEAVDEAPAAAAGRFARDAEPEAGEPELAAPPVSIDEVLDRVERQAVAIARLRGQLRASQQKLATERKARQRLEARLQAGGAGGADREPGDLHRRWAEAIERNRVLEHQVEVAWTQLGVLEAELGARHSRWWKRRRHHSTLPPAS